MFPQLSRRDIQWDLQLNGGSVQATTERVLSGRGLARPPPSFQPLPSPASSSTTATRTPPAPKSTHPDLITRYRLESRISQSDNRSESEEKEKAKAPTWGQTRAERQALLQKRKDEMVLAARRRMEEREMERAREKGKEVGGA
ncbi:MAG: hypothetical protein Q9219_004756 [cf. Caloplaca sp. 3 TL-2023]